MPPASSPLPAPLAALRRRYDALSPAWQRRLPALALALGIELLLVLLLLSLGSVRREAVAMRDTLVAFTSSAEDRQEDEPDSAEAERPAEAAPAAAQPDQPLPERAPPAPDRPTTPVATPPPPLLRNDFSLDSAPPTPPAAQPGQQARPQTYGPAYTPAPGDTPRIAGSGPNGEPLYAARWYREPYREELAGYLSTAQGPGWGLINCRTAPDYRVEDCVVVAESPQGSGIASAVRSAAWQFKVRPPQRNGRPMVGEWVRIRISYTDDPGELARQRLRN